MTNLTSNGNLSSSFVPSSFRPVYDTCIIILACFIVAINILVIYLFMNKDYLRTKTNSFLVSLAVSDLLTGVLSIPFYLICSLTYRPPVCFASAVFYRCIAFSTMAHIMVVTLERYVAVMFPMRYYRMVTKRRICLCIGVVWLFSIFWVTIQLSWLNVNNPRLTSSPEEVKYERIYNITGVLVCFTIPLCVIVFCSTRMFIVIRRQVRNIRRQAKLSVDPRNHSIASDKRALLIFALMLGIFTICWSSWYINLFQFEFGQNAILPETFADVLDFLRFATSLFNPLLYTFLKNDFRRATCSLVSKCCVRQSMFKPKHDLNATRTTLSMDTNGNKSTALLNDCSPTYDPLEEFVRDESQNNSVKKAQNVQLISHV